ncbi:hypothetical protein [Bacillus sp. B1-b2]|uniref:hypothetical protein n=1 Tax=Bacillus sp. B1-b2 TaxID=2653201 RepID=UPI0012617441|nr:hypothetical protein [Bacillus sp. B1-b2]KAB7667767.1 hypothetical protein F9279_14685 [Bacillus sp. B1-b2]
MKYLSLFVVALMFLLAGCGTSADEKKEDTAKQEEKTTASKENAEQKLTEEDKQFIELFKKGEYQTIVDQTVGFGSDAQVNFYFIANAFKSVPDYSLSKTYLNKTKYIPTDIQDEVDKLKADIEANVESPEAS